MERIIEAMARLIQAGKRIYARKLSFLGLFAIAFFGSVSILGALGLLPDAPQAPSAPAIVSEDSVSTNTASPLIAELPVRIEIPKIKLAAPIMNPATTDIAALDAELLKGAVHYPTSAKLGETGNILLFGHSSYLPIVGNRAYKTFNGIQKLAAGDVVTVYSSDTAYTYRVRTVAKESASDALIPLAVTGRVLTLSTCDSFGAKTDRFVVVADFVESHPISI
ncbi:TPA: hypothetical protein DIV48_01750 [Candidatus Kaiserbacteria bacterium]|nr:MAG: hypothetical protein UY93_C0002G0098 [Parcubacteria group bacterium GW2011_GWA1_56_13]KKW45344.1 MAG: hypothetical protein UY97_C0025G0008 [Parcubacteria group bacterium GW2011_GWB1_57_6]HCR52355.1 hypothetical protein [Candidatus Kaiserbacteria bacterium]